MRVCILSLEEVGRLENYNELPRCIEHHHMSPTEAVKGLESDLLVAVGVEQGLFAVTEQWSNNRTWRGRESAGYQVMQLIRAER